jgi:pimeloyl-ACP methyl ester carboxylesterase
MFRLIVLLALLAAPPAARAQIPVLHPSPQFDVVGPTMARGVVVWLHGAYDSDQYPVPPAAQPWVGRMAALGYDIWRLDRTPGHDPLEGGAAALLSGIKTLRHNGYRRVVVAGHSRGAFIALWALSEPKLVDAVAAISPAAHGTDPKRHAAAIAAFAARMKAIPLQHSHPARFAFVTLRDDPLEPDAAKRISLVRRAARHTGLKLLVIDRPPAPRGHMGGYEPAFDSTFGACLVAFLDGQNGHCPGG